MKFCGWENKWAAWCLRAEFQKFRGGPDASGPEHDFNLFGIRLRSVKSLSSSFGQTVR